MYAIRRMTNSKKNSVLETAEMFFGGFILILFGRVGSPGNWFEIVLLQLSAINTGRLLKVAGAGPGQSH